MGNLVMFDHDFKHCNCSFKCNTYSLSGTCYRLIIWSEKWFLQMCTMLTPQAWTLVGSVCINTNHS